jgi:hypothetical protein
LDHRITGRETGNPSCREISEMNIESPSIRASSGDPVLNRSISSLLGF